MDKEKLLETAIKIAMKAHKNQTDRNGMPYILHPLRVMEMGKNLDQKIVGILHDVVEDCLDFPLAFFTVNEFPTHIVFAIDCLTKRDNTDETYTEYLERVILSPLAIQVKLNDLTDNMDLKRSKKAFTEKDLKRFNKYLGAYQFLKSL